MRASMVLRVTVEGGLETKFVRVLAPAKFGSGHRGSSLAAVASQRAAGI